MPSDLDLVMAASRALPEVAHPGGWAGQIEAALIDAVLSIRARYGGPETDVRGAIARYRTAVAVDTVDDLRRLAAYDSGALAGVLRNHQKTGGVTKAAAITEAAQHLVAAGVVSTADFRPDDDTQQRAYLSAKGLGRVTWWYFCMLLGHEDVKVDTWILRFVANALGRPANDIEARRLVTGAAVELDLSATDLDHRIWRHMSNRGRPSR